MDAPREVTRLLQAARAGDDDAAGRLLPLIYAELRAQARRQMRGQAPGHTLQATDLVHEAYMKLVDQRTPWENRAHFLCVAAKAMRSVLVDHARARGARKRGGGRPREALHEEQAWFDERGLDVVALDEALERLAGLDAGKARVVELRFFAGLTIEETARVLDRSHASIERDWAMARAWLARELG